MCQKRGLHYGTTATHSSSDTPSLLDKCVWFLVHYYIQCSAKISSILLYAEILSLIIISGWFIFS